MDLSPCLVNITRGTFREVEVLAGELNVLRAPTATPYRANVHDSCLTSISTEERDAINSARIF